MKLGFWIPIVSRIPDPLSCILDSKAQDSGFHEQNFPEFRILHVKIFSDSGIRIPLRTRGETDRVWKPPSGGSRGEARGTRPPPPLISIISSPNWGPNSWKKVFWDRPLPYLKVRHCHSRSTHIFQFPLSVKNRRYIRVLWMFKLFLAKKPQVNLHGNLKRQTGNGIFIQNTDIPTTDILDFVKRKRPHSADNTVLFWRCRGPFLKRSGNFSRPKGNFKINHYSTCWIVAQLLAHNLFNFALLTDSFIVSFSKLLRRWSWIQKRQTQNSFPGQKRDRDFQTTAPRSYKVRRSRVKCYLEKL